MDRVDLNHVAAAIGLLAIVLVAVLYSTGVSAGELDCGNALRPAGLSQTATAGQPVSDHERCQDAIGARRNLAHLLGLVGIAVSVAVFVFEGAKEVRERREWERHPRGEPPQHS